MKPAAFEYFRPSSLAEALELLDRRGEEAKCLAGGQSLVPLMNLRLSKPRAVIDLNRLADLAYIKAHDGGLAIGALTRQRAVETSGLIRERSPLLAEVTPLIGHFPIRTRGTFGGSLAHADPAAEYPAAVVALEGRVRVASARGERMIDAEKFFVTYLTTALEPTEVLAEVILPPLPPNTATAFLELTRRHGDFAIVGVAAVVTLGEGGSISRARIALCGVGPTPIRAKRAEAALVGQRPSKKLLAEVGRVAMDETDPADDLHGSVEYRREMSAVFTRRTLAVALQRLGVKV